MVQEYVNYHSDVRCTTIGDQCGTGCGESRVCEGVAPAGVPALLMSLLMLKSCIIATHAITGLLRRILVFRNQ